MGGLAARCGVIHVAQQTCFFRRSLYHKIGGLDRHWHCVLDTELWCRMFEAKAVWGHIPDYLGAFRIHGESKGTAAVWLERYQSEQRELAVKYPQFFRLAIGHRLGRLRHGIGQILSGRRLRAALDTHRFRGRVLSDIFTPPTLGSVSLCSVAG